MEQEKIIDVAGIGSPIIDLLAHVPDSFIEELGATKGGMELVMEQELKDILQKLPAEAVCAPGGAAANTTFVLTQLGLKTSFMGMLGRDSLGEYYLENFQNIGGECCHFRHSEDHPTAQCISLITPDAERTMRTHLGAAALFEHHPITAADFSQIKHVHIEGYLLFNADLIQKILFCAKQAQCTISLDLGSFEVVNASRELLRELLKEYVDIVFANELEAEAFAGTTDMDSALETLFEYCAIAAVKLGSKGAMVKNSEIKHWIDPVVTENVVDTTGAGDLWAAGFLYGFVQGHSLETCGRMGAVIGSHAVRHLGSSLTRESWEQLNEEFFELTV
ncbi:adenosine kinase [Chitinispirillales bacterium ANBcel5]|uniref:adenosine kinase n=1 Tax=Cellulosispirillum alkaliphilum TaxID=3039283 RepID=UPI002A5730FD|nr:adenosine kinase [Chitinispirillales bacterium ANBcel5]